MGCCFVACWSSTQRLKNASRKPCPPGQLIGNGYRKSFQLYRVPVNEKCLWIKCLWFFPVLPHTLGEIEDDKYRGDENCTRVHSGRESIVRRVELVTAHDWTRKTISITFTCGRDVFLGGKNSDKNFVARRSAILCGGRSFRDVPARDLTRNIVYFRTVILVFNPIQNALRPTR